MKNLRQRLCLAKSPKNQKIIRPLGEVLLEMEPLLMEMCIDHDLQWGDVLNLVLGYLEVHIPGAQEEYTEGGNPVFYYGPLRSKQKSITEE